MKLIIDIPEDTYIATRNGNMLPPDVKNVVEAIKDGTPLPDKTETVTDFADHCRGCGSYQGQILAELRTKYKKRR